MKVLLDINVVLDVVLERAPWAADSARLLDAAERGAVKAFVAGHTITTAYYVISRNSTARKAATAIADIMRVATIIPVDRADFTQALVLGMTDFEDAVQAAAAAKIGADFIATRNAKDFRRSPVSPRSPAELLAMVAGST